MPTAKRQASLHDVIASSIVHPLSDHQRAAAHWLFCQILDHCKDEQKTPEDEQYSRPLLLQYTFEYARSEESRDNFLRAFFIYLGIPLDLDQGVEIDYDNLAAEVYGFADFLMSSFFVPLRASGQKTQQPTPKYDQAMQRQEQKKKKKSCRLAVGTTERLAGLRGACLVRDKHQCIVTRAFDRDYLRRMLKEGCPLVDDDGLPLGGSNVRPEKLEVAHILPHAFAKAGSEGDPGDLELNEARQTAVGVLNMLDSGVMHPISGINIDRPLNALTLTVSLHDLLGRFDIYFEPAPGLEHTYRINAFYPELAPVQLPVVRTLYSTDQNIGMPSPRLLALHCAIAHILHLSGAGAHIDSLFREMETQGARSDGLTRLDEMVRLRIGGWWDGTAPSL